MIVPLENANEAAVVKDIEVYPVGSLPRPPRAERAAACRADDGDLDALFEQCGS